MDVERTQARLANAQTVEPMLGALRTISLGTWQSAVSRLTGLSEISLEYHSILRALVPILPKARQDKKRSPAKEKKKSDRTLVIMAGTARGLCGRLDQDLIEYVKNSSQIQLSPDKTELVVIGGRLSKAVEKQLLKPDSVIVESSTAMPSYPQIFRMTRDWIRRMGSGELDQVLVVFTAFKGATHREPSAMQLLPYDLDVEATDQPEQWPPPIIETNPVELFVRIYEQLAAIRFYDALLQTKASIHSARFQMMEDSTMNAERLIEDLTVILQTERRQSITREMQELAVGSGLLQN